MSARPASSKEKHRSFGKCHTTPQGNFWRASSARANPVRSHGCANRTSSRKAPRTKTFSSFFHIPTLGLVERWILLFQHSIGTSILGHELSVCVSLSLVTARLARIFDSTEGGGGPNQLSIYATNSKTRQSTVGCGNTV